MFLLIYNRMVGFSHCRIFEIRVFAIKMWEFIQHLFVKIRFLWFLWQKKVGHIIGDFLKNRGEFYLNFATFWGFFFLCGSTGVSNIPVCSSMTHDSS